MGIFMIPLVISIRPFVTAEVVRVLIFGSSSVPVIFKGTPSSGLLSQPPIKGNFGQQLILNLEWRCQGIKINRVCF